MINLRIHGDNIVECERTWRLIISSFECENIQLTNTTLIAPILEAHSKKLNKKIRVQFLPGYGRWNPNIIQYLRDQGGLLREAAYSIICVIENDKSGKHVETPVLAIEFCGALDAGNQAWQRCGRAYSFAVSGIPYLYATDFGGYELGSDRTERAIRYPTPVVPFSYIVTSTLSNAILPVFLPNFSLPKEINETFKNCFGFHEMECIVYNSIMKKDNSSPVKSLINKTLNLVNILSAKRRKKDTYKPDEWNQWLKTINKTKDTISFPKANPLPWSKTAYINALTNTAKRFMIETSKYSIGLGATQVPICLIPTDKKPKFIKTVKSIYKNLPNDFLCWLENCDDVAICWIMGFKPRGDDARPDRGLTPLARMLLGKNINLLTFVYGPAKEFTWPLLKDKPNILADRNGLWESILRLSDAILIDSATDNVTSKGYPKSHWEQTLPRVTPTPLLCEDVKPLGLNENDVDTIFHILLTSDKDIFEGMCNPPGGDWSGISLISTKNNKELRWLSLPRVGSKDGKRPDHVFQFLTDKPIILSVESKENASATEQDIGKRLNKYLQNLMNHNASVERDLNKGAWTKCTSKLNTNDYEFVSGICFLQATDGDLINAGKISNADIVVGVKLDRDGTNCQINILARNEPGKKVAQIIHKITKKQKLPIKTNLII